MGVYSAPNRTSNVFCTAPSITQRRVWLDLSTHSTRPVVHRGSSAPGTLSPCWLVSSAWVGSVVMPCSRFSVRWSTSPVTGISRLAWKPRTASVVTSP